ncbi:MAG: sugar-binding protein, partial [Roseimicrobium sp.]
MSFRYRVVANDSNGVTIGTSYAWIQIPAGELVGGTGAFDPDEGNTINVSYAPPEEPDPVPKGTPFTFTGSDGAGPRYRKIGLNGAPLSDSKPQVQDESGEVPEETYIDALSRELRHSVTEVYASVDSSMLPLMVRRDLASDTWNPKSGLRPLERADRPFGSGWSSNITAHIRLENALKVYITDEQGSGQVFLWNGDAWVHTKEERVDAKAAMNTLENVFEGTQLVGFTYRKKFGTVCHFRKCELLQAFPADRVQGQGDLTINQYFRLTKAEDRLGNELVYSYPSTKTLIPQTISDPDRPGHRVSIRQENGVVAAVRGPGGDTTSYTYTTIDGAPALTAVEREGATVHYAYSTELEPDPNPVPEGGSSTPINHIAVNKITDENGGEYTFTLALNEGVTYTKYDEYGQEQTLQQTGLPRYVTKVVLPDTDPNDNLENSTVFGGVRTLHISSPSLEGVEAEAYTTVHGPGGDATYEFSLPDVFVPLVPDITNIDDPFSRHLTVSFQKMRVARGEVYGAMVGIPPQAGVEVYEFDAEKNMSLVKSIDLHGNETLFTYDWFDDPDTETNALGGVKSFTYDPATRVMASSTDAAGVRTEYDIQANTGLRTEERVKSPSGTVLRRTLFEYTHATFKGFMTKQIVKAFPNSFTDYGMGDQVTQFLPDAQGRVKEQRLVKSTGLPLKTTYHYDYAGNKRFVVDPRNKVTEFSYDQKHRLRRATQADGTRKQIAYDPHGNVVLEVNELGTYTFHAYDVLNRRVRTTVDLDGGKDADPRSANVDLVTDVEYNGMNLPVREIGPTGLVTEHEYDHLGRRTKTTVNPGGGALELETTFEYGANSGGSVFDTSGFKPTESEGPRGEVTTVVYDDLYRPTSTTVSQGGTTTTEYDVVGRPIEVTDALNRTTVTTYDHLGQVIEVDLPGGTEVKSTYTHHGQPWRVEDELGRVTTKQFDSVGRPVSVTNALGHIVSTTYDAAGNAITVTDPRGNTTETTYDALNRPLEVKAPTVVDGVTGLPARPVTSTTYDAAGQPLTVTDPLGNVTTNTYDRVGRVVKVKNALNQETLSMYNAGGQVLTVTDARGKVTTNAYDVLGRLTQTTDAENVVTQFEYDKAGNRTLVQDGKDNETTFAYDLRNRVTLEHFANGDETSYTYNAIQKLTRTDAAGTTTYGYDDRDRLLTVDLPTGPDRTYAYDDAGQLL